MEVLQYLLICRGALPTPSEARTPLASVTKKSRESLNQLCIDSLGSDASVHTYASLLRHCTQAKALLPGKFLHSHISNSKHSGDRFLANLLLHMYGSCGAMEEARALFDSMPNSNAYSWNIMIAAYAQNGNLMEARSLFHRMPSRDVVSWNSIIMAFAKNGLANEALLLFQQMGMEGIRPNRSTFISALHACGCLHALVQGKKIHASIIANGLQSDMAVVTALVNMYGKCKSLNDAKAVFYNTPQHNVICCNAMITAFGQNGNLSDARAIFDTMPRRDVFSWTALIAAHAQNGHGKKALHLFQEMESHGVTPNKITFVCVLDACTGLAALQRGKDIHARIVDRGFESDVLVGTALVNMYAKCGSLDDSRSVFDKINQPDVVCWTAMITAYARSGHHKMVFELLQMMHLAGIKPNKVTFISILFACSHAGLLDDGWQYFVSMSRDHGIAPTEEHYGCMIDLIGRTGQLDVATDFLNAMPFKPNTVSWMALLDACRNHYDAEQGIHAAKHAILLDPENDGSHVLLSNTYAAFGRTREAAEVRKEVESWSKGPKTQLSSEIL